ncbi:hypothetical protein E4U36_007131 [Claviceps purpurea]|nr:hypothetical protein E4U36_007131 [Claviceps purpurea]
MSWARIYEEAVDAAALRNKGHDLDSRADISLDGRRPLNRECRRTLPGLPGLPRVPLSRSRSRPCSREYGVITSERLFRLSTIRLAVIRRMPLLCHTVDAPRRQQQQLLLDNSHPGRNLHTLAGTPDAKASLSLIRRSIRSPTEMALPSTVRVC